MDMVNTNRWKKTLRSVLPSSLYASYVANKLNQRIDHDLCSLRPPHSPFDQVSDLFWGMAGDGWGLGRGEGRRCVCVVGGGGWGWGQRDVNLVLLCSSLLSYVPFCVCLFHLFL